MEESIQANPVKPFDPSLLRDRSLAARARIWLNDHLTPIFAVARVVWPNLRLGRFVYATQRDDVEAILDDSKAFGVRFGERVASLRADISIPFGLGTDGPAYFTALKQVSGAMVLEDIPRIGNIVRGYVEPRVANGQEVDLAELARLAQADCARHYLGLVVTDKLLPDFALWCLAIGNYAFGSQKPDSAAKFAGSAAVAQLVPVVRASIDPTRAGQDTVIGRLHAAGIDKKTIDVTVVGMTIGMMSASTMAIANTARVLLERPAAMKDTRAAAQCDDDELLRLCLLEALRFKPIFPWAYRDCNEDCVIAAGTRREIRIRPGEVVVPVTQSAMFDARRVVAPQVFNPRRSPADTLVFGYGRHWCAGFAIGRAQLVETLKPMLKRGFHQTRAQRKAITYFGAFPEHLPVRLG
jgi:cytochrome P450